MLQPTTNTYLALAPQNNLMSSKRIAERTEKQHPHVLRDIRQMLKDLDDPNLDDSDFQIVSDGRGYASEILLNERLSLCLGSGYSVKLRMAIIDDWAKMKAEATHPMSIEDMIIASAQSMKEVKAQMTALESKVNLIEAQTKTRPDYFTIVGYATLNRMQVGLKLAADLGRRASAICRREGFEMEELPDPRFGLVKTYPETVLKQVFNVQLAY